MEETISLIEIINLLRKRFFLILGTTLLGALCAFIFSFYFITPTYTASNQLLVNPIKSDEQAANQFNDLQTDIQMISTYKDILKGPIILNEVQKRLETPLSTQAIASKITIETQPNSKVFAIKIIDSDAKRAATLANLISDVFQEKIGELMRIDNVHSISSAEVNLQPVGPNKTLNILIGTIIGLIMGIGFSFLLEFLNLKVRDETYLINHLDLTHLGTLSVIVEDGAGQQSSNLALTRSTRFKK